MRLRNRYRYTVVLGLITLLGVQFAPQPVAATNDLGARVPDGTPTLLFRHSLTIGFSDATEWVRLNDLNPTDLTTAYASSVETTYLNIVDNDYGDSGFVGLYDCATGPNSGVCQRGDVLVNLYAPYVPGGTWSATERRSLLCEEVGHALGLAHRYTGTGSTSSCMSQDWANTLWSAHDVSHINNWY